MNHHLLLAAEQAQKTVGTPGSICVSLWSLRHGHHGRSVAGIEK